MPLPSGTYKDQEVLWVEMKSGFGFVSRVNQKTATNHSQHPERSLLENWSRATGQWPWENRLLDWFKVMVNHWHTCKIDF